MVSERFAGPEDVVLLKQWLVRQFFATRTDAGPAREVTEAIAATIFRRALVTLISDDVDESGDIDVKGKLFGLCALLCRHGS